MNDYKQSLRRIEEGGGLASSHRLLQTVVDITPG
jgi:hypothetical protein